MAAAVENDPKISMYDG